MLVSNWTVQFRSSRQYRLNPSPDMLAQPSADNAVGQAAMTRDGAAQR
jgi:hypothetical protein